MKNPKYLKERPIAEIIKVVQHLLDSKEEFPAYSIESFFNDRGVIFSRVTVANLRKTKTTLENSSLSTIAKLYYFAEYHKGVRK